MNTNPDESTLALWLDDELTGEQLANVESWAVAHPDQLAAREAVRQWRATIASAIPAVEEPPFPDFFNSRVLQAIREESPQPEVIRKKPAFWNSWLMPMAACAGMVVAFWFGRSQVEAPDYDVANAPRAIPVDPVIYTPESGVEAEYFASTDASAMVIVLNGVSAIPDATDFSSTVSVPLQSDFDSTAETEMQPALETGP